MRKLSFVLFLFLGISLNAQVNLGYQKPSEEILELVDVELSPFVSLNNKMDMMLLLYRDPYKSIDELSETELRLGGLRINPKTNIGSRTTYYNNLRLKPANGKNTKALDIKNLPEKRKIANIAWSPNEKYIAFTNTVSNGVELWLIDVEKAEAKKISEANLNANLRDVINWNTDSKSLLVKMLPNDRKELINASESTPKGPTVSVSDGKKAQNRTYQDLLKNPNDEFNFEQLAYSEIYLIDVNGNKKLWKSKAMYDNISVSPDGEYVLVEKIEKPFSYIVPYRRFPVLTEVVDKNGKLIHTVNKTPLLEVLPKGFMATQEGKRNFSWRNDKASSLIFVKALDKGDPEIEADYRDEIFELEAPFKGEAKSILKVKNRFSGITWGDKNTAIASDYWWNNRNTKNYLFNPSKPGKNVKIIYDRNYQDVYSDPGNFVTRKNKYNKNVLAIKNNKFFMIGDGYSEDGQFPFLSEFDMKKLKSSKIYVSKYKDKLESLSKFDLDKNKLLVRIESKNEFPNYYFRDLKNNKLEQQTFFENPFKALEEVHKEIITYKRDDGLELSATMYLPIGYEKEEKEKAPMIIWAYPREYKDKSSASQNTNNPNEFVYPYYGSMVYWVTKGYIVLDNAAFPIVGVGENEPNDSFREQLVANAKAAIDAVDELGYVDRDRVACGGHSYGAFMVANLLTHSDLFAAGIARSGAYNRTLTPFGFQSEERSYWEAPEIYNGMSPFMHADKMKHPLLLIHGEADNNSGTYPLQSERYFNALKGHGATVRLVMLPKESHGYRAKESILHLLWEQDQWLDKYVKNKKTE